MSKPFLNGKRNRKIGGFFLLAVLSAGPVGAAEILEYLTPSPDSSPSDLAFDAQGNLWFTEINGNKIGKLVPSETEPGTSKGIQEYELPNPNSKPNYLIVSKDGQVWYSEMAGRISRTHPEKRTTSPGGRRRRIDLVPGIRNQQDRPAQSEIGVHKRIRHQRGASARPGA